MILLSLSIFQLILNRSLLHFPKSSNPLFSKPVPPPYFEQKQLKILRGSLFEVKKLNHHHKKLTFAWVLSHRIKFFFSVKDNYIRILENVKKEKFMSTIYAIQFKESEPQRIQKLLDYVQSLDFVQSVKPFFDEAGVVEKPLSVTIEGYLTTEEIKKLYPNQWVLLSHTQKNDTHIIGGKILLHEADKRELALKGRDLIRQFPDVNHFYTGEFPAHARIGLLRKTSK